MTLRLRLPGRGDVALAGTLLAVSQVEVWGYGAAGGSMAAALTLGAAAAVLVLSRTRPVVTAALVSVALSLCAGWAGEPFSATSVVAFTVAFFNVGAMPQRRVSLVALAVACVLSVLAVSPLTLSDYLAVTLSSVGVPWLLGLLWLRHRGAREEERRRREAAEQAVAEERLRLAQELHDVVSHNVGMIAVQAGAADILLDKDPPASRESLRAIEHGARTTLLELRRMLGLLREDDPDPLTQRTTLAELPVLIEPLGRAGLEVTLDVGGDPVALGREIETAAYRVVQEALTNVVKHAGPCRVRVTVRYSPERLHVEVADDGVPQSMPGSGYGLNGIRERVTALGGTVFAGPRAGGGFVVQALLPVATQ